MSSEYGTHIYCESLPRLAGAKLTRYAVMTMDGATMLGEIKWFGKWRCYSFFPVPERVFEKVCLREIATWCEDLTKMVRESWKLKALQVKRQAAPNDPVGVAILGGDPSL